MNSNKTITSLVVFSVILLLVGTLPVMAEEKKTQEEIKNEALEDYGEGTIIPGGYTATEVSGGHEFTNRNDMDSFSTLKLGKILDAKLSYGVSMKIIDSAGGGKRIELDGYPGAKEIKIGDIPLKNIQNAVIEIDANGNLKSIKFNTNQDGRYTFDASGKTTGLKASGNLNFVAKAGSMIEIDFEKGVPVALDGKKMPGLEIISRLNRDAGAYGIGRIDMVENRLIGIKSREIYESPAAEVLIEAHRQLEALVLDRELVHYKYLIEEKMAELIYYGLWFTPLKDSLLAFIENSQEYVTGKIRIRFDHKSFKIVGRKSEYSLYELKLATYDSTDEFDPGHSESFIKLYGYPYEILGRKGRINE